MSSGIAVASLAIFAFVIAESLVQNKIKEHLRRQHPNVWFSLPYPDLAANFNDESYNPVRDRADAAFSSFLKSDARRALSDKVLDGLIIWRYFFRGLWILDVVLLILLSVGTHSPI